MIWQILSKNLKAHLQHSQKFRSPSNKMSKISWSLPPKHNLQQYADKFIELGYDDLNQLQGKLMEELKDVLKDAGILSWTPQKIPGCYADSAVQGNA